MLLLKKAARTLASLQPQKERPPVPKIQHMSFQGLDISIETDKGQYRHWKDHLTGREGKTLMRCPYGYIRGSKGSDGEQVDCFIGQNEEATHAYIVKQVHPDKRHHDEEKTMLGFDSEEEAKWTYLQHYDSPLYFGGITTMPMPEFKRKVLKTAEEPGKVEKSWFSRLLLKFRKADNGKSDLRQAYEQHLDQYREGKRGETIEGTRDDYLDHVGEAWQHKKAAGPYDDNLRIINQAWAIAEQFLDEQVKKLQDGQKSLAEEFDHLQGEITGMAKQIQAKWKRGEGVASLVKEYRGLLKRRREVAGALNIGDELINRGQTHYWPEPEKEENPWV